jgi:predicted nucleic acid-binding protein
MYLIDANVILEIVLKQQKAGNCKAFLRDNTGLLFISDFALHTIGVIFFRNDQEDDFQTFVQEGLNNMDVLTLPQSGYAELKAIRSKWQLDFDDAYQFAVAREFGLCLVTMDRHFRLVEKEIEVQFM